MDQQQKFLVLIGLVYKYSPVTYENVFIIAFMTAEICSNSGFIIRLYSCEGYETFSLVVSIPNFDKPYHFRKSTLYKKSDSYLPQ